MSGLQVGSGVDEAGDVDQGVVWWQVAVGGREVRRTLGVRAVVGAAGGYADHADAEVGEYPE